MDNIRDEISKEMSICDAEIRKAREEIIRLTERKLLFDDVYAIGFYLRTSGGECVTICWLDEYQNDFDIIGNIYDNPELLEVSKNEM